MIIAAYLSNSMHEEGSLLIHIGTGKNQGASATLYNLKERQSSQYLSANNNCKYTTTVPRR
jgi:hypothetical protein